MQQRHIRPIKTRGLGRSSAVPAAGPGIWKLAYESAFPGPVRFLDGSISWYVFGRKNGSKKPQWLQGPDVKILRIRHVCHTYMVIESKERDEWLVKLLADELLLVTREQVEALMGQKARGANKRLARLVEKKLLARRTSERRRERSYFLYYLGEKAAELLDRDADEIQQRRRRAGRFKASALDHEYLLNWVHIRFITADRNYTDYKLERWISSDDDVWEAIRLGLRPDGYAEVAIGERQFSYFIEVDRDTERGKYIREKIEAYRVYEASQKFARQFQRRWFRVLFVTEKDARSKALAKLFPSDTFWTATIEDVRSKSLVDGYWRSRSDVDLGLDFGPGADSIGSMERREIVKDRLSEAPEPPAESHPQDEMKRSMARQVDGEARRSEQEFHRLDADEETSWKGLALMWAVVFVLGLILGGLIAAIIRGVWWVQDMMAGR